MNIGEKVSRLTALSLDHIGKHYRSYYLFRCDCGKEKVILGSLVTSGNTKSCGCLVREVGRAKLLPGNRGVINQIILGYKRHAKGRGFAWNLSFENVAEVIVKPCYFCGAAPSNIKITKNCRGGFRYNSIDRTDSLQGYEPDNIVPACDFCNRAKGNKTNGEFLAWVKRINEHQNAMAEQWG